MARNNNPSPSALYWRDREKRWMTDQARTEARTARELSRRYKAAYKSVENKIAAEFGRYAGPRGYTMAEAQALADMQDVRLLAEKARQWVKTKDFTDEANRTLKLYNLRMRTSRLELLKNEIALELIALGSDEQKLIGNLLTREGVKHMTEQAGILNLTIKDTARRVEKIADASFQTATWSDRIWANQDALRGEVDKLLTRGVLNGEHALKVAEDLEERFNVTEHEAERLSRTELSRVHTEVSEELYREAGYTQYEYIAEDTACDDCADLDGEVLELADAVVGINKPPMHPNCKCAIAPYYQIEGQTPPR